MSKSRPDEPICKWSRKELERNVEYLVREVRAPRYLCVKCGRAARHKKSICKAKKVAELSEKSA